MIDGDPRADPSVIDLIELAGLWLAAGDRQALIRSLRQLRDVLNQRYATHAEFRRRFVELLELVEANRDADELRRRYRRATLG